MVHWALGDEYMGNAMIPDLATADGVQNGIINNRSGDGPVFQPVADRHGAANKALEITRNDYLSSTYGYVNCPAVTSLPPAVTLALWVATESSSGDGLLFGIRRGPHLYQDNGAVTAQVPDSPLDVTGVGSVPLTRDRWTFVAGVFTSPAAAGGAWAVSLYVDGALVASGTPANANIATIGELMMGGLFDCITPDSGSDDYICDYGFVGALDNARLYGRALSAGEIETLFQLP
jgi:hypothetical protein